MDAVIHPSTDSSPCCLLGPLLCISCGHVLAYFALAGVSSKHTLLRQVLCDDKGLSLQPVRSVADGTDGQADGCEKVGTRLSIQCIHSFARLMAGVCVGV